MAYSRRRSAGSRRSSRITPRRSGYRKAPARTRRSTARRASRGQTVKIVIEHAGRPDPTELRQLGQMVSPTGKRKARF